MSEVTREASALDPLAELELELSRPLIKYLFAPTEKHEELDPTVAVQLKNRRHWPATALGATNGPVASWGAAAEI